MKTLKTVAYICLCIAIAYSCSSTKGNYKVNPVSGHATELSQGLVYMLPKTIIEVELEIEKQEIEKGIYADYAKQYLGISNVNKNSSTQYYLRNAEILTYAEADASQTYFVDPKSSTLSISLNEKGILEGVNQKAHKPLLKGKESGNERTDENLNAYESQNRTYILHPEQEKKVKQRNFIKVDSLYVELPPTSPKALSEKSMDTKAKETAEYIQKIREKKMALISGEYEDQYSPNAVEFLYQKLETIEKQYLALFVGNTQSTVIKRKIKVELNKSDFTANDISIALCHFSKETGIMDINKTGGSNNETVYLKATNLKTTQNIAKLNKADGKEEVRFVYRMPETINAAVYLDDNELTKETINIAQIGEIMHLPNLKFRASFDSKSGALLEYKIIKD